MHAMKHLLILLFIVTQFAQAASSPDWITETPLEFIATGRFQTPSDGRDLVVVDKATGLARLGLKNGANITWMELPTGISGITGFTTLRNVGIDALIATSSTWNAIQFIPADGSPLTFTSPVIGPQTLVRNSTGHIAGSIVEDTIAFSDLDGVNMGSVDNTGATVFASAITSLHRQAQSITVSPTPAIPVMIAVRENRLRMDLMTRTGFESTLHIGATHPAGLHWAAARKNLLYSIAKDGTTLFQHRLTSGTNAGWWQPVSLASTTDHALSDIVLTLDTVPWSDATEPNLDSLVAVRFTSSPDVLRLYRVWDLPAPSITELMTLPMTPGHEFAALVADGDDFTLLSGPGGRVQSWKRFHQPAPGELPEEIASGSLPALRTRGAHPNIFIFNQDPFLTNGAVLTSSQNRLDWTRLTTLASYGETDLGLLAGLGSEQSITVQAPGGVPIGNQLLDSASVAGFGPLQGLLRLAVTLQPPPGPYSALTSGVPFPVRFSTTTTDAAIHYRIDDGAWTLYSDDTPPKLTADSTVSAYAIDTTAGTRSLLATGSYTFAPLTPASPATSVDADSNGLSDAWERAFGITDPNADDDGDGFNAITEQNYGTDPLDAGSHPAGGNTPEAEIAAATVQAGQITLAWPDGLVGYILESSPDLQNWTPVNPQPIDNTWSEPITGPREFYRLRKL